MRALFFLVRGSRRCLSDRDRAAQSIRALPPADEVYERSLRVAVQLIGSPRVDAGKNQKRP